MLDTMENNHTHRICKIVIGKTRNTNPNDLKQMIEKETTDGMIPGKIRLLRGLTCSSDTLYAT